MFYFISLLLFLTGPVSGSPEMRALQDRLLGNYSVHVRPVLNESDEVKVRFAVHLSNILDLDLKAQTLKSSGFLDLVWQDEYLEWLPADYGNITAITIPQNMVWLPDIVVYNDVRGVAFLGNDRTWVHVSYEGKITWQPDFLAETDCKVDIYKYPFDQQKCEIRFLPWMTTSKQMKLNYSAFITSQAVINGEFQLLESSVETLKEETTFSADYLAKGIFKIVLQRRSSFYVLSTVMPLFAFSLLSPMALLVPADSGEKVTLSVTVLLANLVFMGTLSSSMPSVADSISVFVLYSSLQIILSFIAVIANVINLCISRMPEADPDNQKATDNNAQDTANENVLSKTSKSLYRWVFTPGSKQFPAQDSPKPKPMGISTVQDLAKKLEYSSPTGYTYKGNDSASLHENRSWKDKPSPIARRDLLCFVFFLLVVLFASILVISILVG